MRSSKLENIFNYTPVPEETKSLSPLTYYQPFQSTFDPEFATKSSTPREDTRSRWEQGVETQTNLQIPGGGILNPRNYNPTPSYPQAPKTYPTASTSTWRGENQSSIFVPRHSHPTYEEEGKSLGLYSQLPQRGESFAAFDSSYRTGSTQYNPEAPGYSLFGNYGRNAFKSGQSRPMMCNFCKNNKEVPDIYLNHYLYDPETKVLTCPVLRKHVCEICGGTGDRAHTLQYCPVNRERGLQAKVPVLLKTRTITNSTGKIRRN